MPEDDNTPDSPDSPRSPDQPGQRSGAASGGESESEQAQESSQSRRGAMRFQDAETTARREPSVAEQRARRQALTEERERRAAAERAQQAAERKSETRRKVFIGTGVTVGLVGLVAGWYLVATPDEVTAVCTDANGTVVENDDYCDEEYVRDQGGHVSGGFMFLPMPGGGMQQYRYNYGGTGSPGQTVQGGSFSKPSNASISTQSGKTVQRGGFGISGGNFGKSGGS